MSNRIDINKYIPNFKKVSDLYRERSFVIEDTKEENKTIALIEGDRKLFLNSKYNPDRESEIFINNIENLDEYEHVVFIGLGAGYHLKKLFHNFKGSITLVEPNIEIVEVLHDNNMLDFLEGKERSLNMIFLNEKYALGNFQLLRDNLLNKKTKMVSLKSYEKHFSDDLKYIDGFIINLMKNTKKSYATNYSFQRRWITNSVGNLKHNLETVDIFDLKEKFKGKPGIIAAAGPSLAEEIENLKYIKEHKLAYIFAVGSAVRAFHSYGLEPDAMLTYDPSHLNREVFTEMIDQTNHSVPLIYGSSVAFEILNDYHGPKAYFTTSQDKVLYNYLKDKDGNAKKVVNDSTSIASMTLQVMQKLEMSPIIFVGQNLGFKDNRIYSEGISTNRRSSEIIDSDKKEMIEVEGTQGETILSKDSYISMRKELDNIMLLNKNIEYINTTVGGAKLFNATFQKMDMLIKDKLSEIEVADLKKVFRSEGKKFNVDSLKKTNEKILKDRDKLTKDIDAVTDVLNKIDHYCDRYNTKDLIKAFKVLDGVTNTMRNNVFYSVFVSSLNKVNHNRLLTKMNDIKYEKNIVKKGRTIVQEFGSYLASIYEQYEFSYALSNNANEYIENYFNVKNLLLLESDKTDIEFDGFIVAKKSDVITDDSKSFEELLQEYIEKEEVKFNNILYVNDEILSKIDKDKIIKILEDNQDVKLLFSKARDIYVYNDGKYSKSDDAFSPIGDYFAANWQSIRNRNVSIDKIEI